MKIANVKAECFRVPSALPLLDEPMIRPLVIVTVETDEGITGHGLTSGTPQMISSIAEFINSEAGPYVRGMDPALTERVWGAVLRRYNRRGLSGVWSSGMSGLDIALWDIKGKYFNRPIADLLGGASDRARAYVTFGVNEYNLDQLQEVARSLVDDGIVALKMVVGDPNVDKTFAYWGEGSERAFSADLRHDEARIRAVREAVGDGIDVMIDANYRLTVAEAKRLARRVEDCDIAWFEEPVWGNDPVELAELKAHTSTPIGAGQNLGTLAAHRELIANNSVDLVMPNVCFVGGYTEALKVANLAKAFNKPIANGAGWPQHNMHLHAGVSNGGPVEFHFSAWKTVEILYDNPPKPQGPWVYVPEASGLGFSPIQAAMDEYRVNS